MSISDNKESWGCYYARRVIYWWVPIRPICELKLFERMFANARPSHQPATADHTISDRDQMQGSPIRAESDLLHPHHRGDRRATRPTQAGNRRSGRAHL